MIDHTLHRLRGIIKTNCEWHCNFTFSKMANQVRCTTLEGTYNHETNSTQILNIIASYKHFNKEMI